MDRSLAVLRLARGWTQAQLAQASRIHSTSISEYERGKTLPETRSLLRLLDAMGYDMARLQEVESFMRRFDPGVTDVPRQVDAVDLVTHELATEVASTAYRLTVALLGSRSLAPHSGSEPGP